MSEQINKVLASTSQAFTTAEQAQARQNIDAQKTIAYSYDGTRITAIDNSAVGLNAVSANNCISGDGTSGSPLGLSSRARFENSLSATIIGPNELNVHNHIGTAYLSNSFIRLNNVLNGGTTAYMNATALKFTDSAEQTQQVDASSIQRWNSYSGGGWNESGNSLSTGYGGSPVSAAWQYNETGNWAARTVGISGSPDQTMYGFQSKPNGTATYGVNAAGAFVRIPQQNYFTYLFHVTGAMSHQFDIEIYPTGLTANARLDFVNLCSAASANIKTDTFHGTTATINPGESATMWYIATANIWTDGRNPVPV